MITTSLKQTAQELHLRVIKNSVNSNKIVKELIYINTLFPGFSCINKNGVTVTPRKCILLKLFR